MDRGYIDFARLYVFVLAAAFFVVRTKSNMLIQRLYSHSVDKTTGVRSDQTVEFTSPESVKSYPDKLRRISYLDMREFRLSSGRKGLEGESATKKTAAGRRNLNPPFPVSPSGGKPGREGSPHAAKNRRLPPPEGFQPAPLKPPLCIPPPSREAGNTAAARTLPPVAPQPWVSPSNNHGRS